MSQESRLKHLEAKLPQENCDRYFHGHLLVNLVTNGEIIGRHCEIVVFKNGMNYGRDYCERHSTVSRINYLIGDCKVALNYQHQDLRCPDCQKVMKKAISDRYCFWSCEACQIQQTFLQNNWNIGRSSYEF